MTSTRRSRAQAPVRVALSVLVVVLAASGCVHHDRPGAAPSASRPSASGSRAPWRPTARASARPTVHPTAPSTAPSTARSPLEAPANPFSNGIPTDPSRKPTPRPVPTPASAWSRPGADGAVAAAAHLIDLTDYGLATGDPAPLRAVSAPGCTFCTSAMTSAETVASAGAPLTTRSHTYVSARSSQKGSSWVVDLTTQETYTTAYVAQGVQYLDITAPRTVVFGVQVTRVGDGWLVEGAQHR